MEGSETPPNKGCTMSMVVNYMDVNKLTSQDRYTTYIEYSPACGKTHSLQKLLGAFLLRKRLLTSAHRWHQM
jgi:hypothetical protein